MESMTLLNNIPKLFSDNELSISQLEREFYMSSELILCWTKNVPTLDRILDIAHFLMFHWTWLPVTVQNVQPKNNCPIV